MKESDELFELRMLFYNKYPELAQNLYIDVKAMIKHCESRTIRLIAFWLENKIKSKGKMFIGMRKNLLLKKILICYGMVSMS